MATSMEDLPLCTSNVKQLVKIRMGNKGVAGRAPQTVFEMFDATVAKYGDRPSLHQKILQPVSVCH